ncbi:hypothetical protein O1L60_33060 [Streptomyces diastatochromogenes]|nr:hypothetical protein [Streptomyces diastatochromogenes]
MSAKFGYQVDPAQQARYDKALRAADARPQLSADAQLVLGGTDVPAELLEKVGPEARRGFYAGRRIPEGGCFGEARRTLGGPVQECPRWCSASRTSRTPVHGRPAGEGGVRALVRLHEGQGLHVPGSHGRQ